MKHLFYLVLSPLCCLHGYTQDLHSTETPPAVPAARVVKYLALGDSYTLGESVNQAGSFPFQLAGNLNSNRNIRVETPKVVARTGWTTGDLLNALSRESITDTFDLVTLLIGVNNLYQGKDTGEYALQFDQLIKKAIAFAGGNREKVAVLSIPDYGYTPYGTAKRAHVTAQTDIFNAINRRITLSYGIQYHDITPVSRNTDPTLVARDGLHPSAVQYRLWVRQISEGIMKMLLKNG